MSLIKQQFKLFYERPTLSVVGIILFGILSSLLFIVSSSGAESIEELRQESAAIEAEIAEADRTVADLSNKATNIEDALDELNADIVQAGERITATNERIGSLQDDLDEAEKELERQKDLLKTSMRTLYKRGGASTIELIAASDNFSEFIDEQEYLERIKVAINDSANEVIALQEKIEDQKEEQEALLVQQRSAKRRLDEARSERQQLLDETISEEERLRNHSRALAQRQSEINQELARLTRIVSSTGTGSYPWSDAICAATGSVSGDCWDYEWYLPSSGNRLDPWGYYLRNCTSYVAWRSAQMGLVLSGNGSMGNGGRWADNAYKYGLPTGYTPRVGAFAVFTGGFYGHVAYVEAVSGNEVLVSEYNYVEDGEYSERWIDLDSFAAPSRYVYPPWAQ